jgi:hypothetical protein|tara:strand:- start:1496 stop:1906 length:411 start_codon:yes stop_codon:yes gene_type:complete
MKAIKATNGEWVNLSNHLPTLLKLEGKEFATAVAVNTGILRNSLKHLEGILSPSPAFAELAEKMKPYQNKTDKKSLAAAEKLKKENADVIEARQKQIDEVNAILADEFELEVYPITPEMYPDNINAEQILGLEILK